MLNLKALTLAVIIGVLTPTISINVLNESSVLAQTQQERQAEADRFLKQGIQQGRTSQFREAIQSFQQALEIYREIGVSEAPTKEARNGEAKSLDYLGSSYYSLGQYQKAIEFYQQSLAIDREIGDSPEERLRQRNGEANSLNNLGNAYWYLGQYQKAIEFHQQSLTIKREIGDRSGEAASVTLTDCLRKVIANSGWFCCSSE
ncbi:MAG: tetratricopeptide repeat protein [Cyanobacteria bacterium J06592_8]